MYKFLPKYLIAATMFAFTTTSYAITPEVVVKKDPELLAEAAKYCNVDLVICLDTSNSMDELIDSAKIQLWSIVNSLGKADPPPRLRVALYSYGNTNHLAENGWVDHVLPFTDDLDLVYKKLFELKTNGGYEYVARVTRAALQQSWKNDDQKTLRLIFVAGNESAAQDPTYTLASVMEQAKKQNVFVNTIFCEDPRSSEYESWKEAALLADGKYACINPARRKTYHTPYDDDLVSLSSKLNSTYIFYGAREERQRYSTNQVAQDANAFSLSSAVATQRAVAKSNSAVYNNGERDLVDLYNADKNSALTKNAEELPEELKGKSQDEIEDYILAKEKERKSIQDEIAALNLKRLANIETQKRAGGDEAGTTLDDVMISAIKEQAKTQGITIP
ncbi:MAG: VWA domain-containing protein [Sumerlaeia bacterium]